MNPFRRIRELEESRARLLAKIFISITDRENPFQQMYVELSLEDAAKFIDHLKYETGKK
jgi:hypothetical protein